MSKLVMEINSVCGPKKCNKVKDIASFSLLTGQDFPVVC